MLAAMTDTLKTAGTGGAHALVLIPARMASTRLPDKPLADIAGAPMIVHVLRRAEEAAVGPVVVAAGEAAIKAAVEAAGGRAVLTRPDHASGSDRIFEALQAVDPDGAYDVVVNLQGDLPTLDPALVRGVHECLVNTGADIATLVADLVDDGEWQNSNVVKAIVDFDDREGAIVPDVIAQDFRRSPDPADRTRAYHHIGIYAYRRAALERFVGLAPSPREVAERLEQLRALEAGMTIAARHVDTVPLGVDTAQDLERARKILSES